MAELTGLCFERERLLLRWIDGAKHLRELLDEQLAALRSYASSSAGFEDQIRLARAGEVEACRKYFLHVNAHKCV